MVRHHSSKVETELKVNGKSMAQGMNGLRWCLYGGCQQYQPSIWSAMMWWDRMKKVVDSGSSTLTGV
ncbi:hypothetical protein QVD17_20196 [Tagetes erecta]|uniref:Uncharacterized protein n=1 Tax=Tagetes erecta TaxID=13708 RepID=A0AAD8KPH9_TARER|nr:hypothetical protein QVD17_20196 [Tagetes erecta]